MADHIHFATPVDGTDLQFDAAKTLTQFLLDSLHHLVYLAHPHESVDAYVALALGQRTRIVDTLASGGIVAYRLLQPEL